MLDNDTIEFHYHNILNGFSPFLYDGEVYFAKHISSKEVFEANANNVLLQQRMRAMGIASEREILKDCVTKGLWDDSQDRAITDIRVTITKKQAMLSKLMMPSQVKGEKNQIASLTRSLNEKLNIKHNLLINSLEQRLILEKRDYMGFLGIYKTPTERFWQSYESFLDGDVNLSNALISIYIITLNEITNDVIRSIALSTDARFKIVNSSLKSPETATTNYLELRQWCDFYNRIYELEDKPDESIIKDNDKLDGWLTARRAKQHVEKSVNNNGGMTGMFGATKEDMQAFEGITREEALGYKGENG